jgi:UDP:flavonoid glycosyltransferase YjiC (YdhE family)
VRALLATYAGAGHVLPMTRLADRLREAGHEAVVLSAGDVTGGRTYESVPAPPPGTFEESISAYGEVLFGHALAAEVRDVARAIDADVVVADALVPAALCGAHASSAAAVTLLNLPYGRLRAELSAGSGWWAAQLPALNAVRSTLGLDPYPSPLASWEAAMLMVLLGIPELEDPGTSVPDHLHFVGPCLPRVPVAVPAGDLPRVVVSLSSSDMGHAGTLQSVLNGLARVDADVVATTAGVVDPTTLTVPEGIEVHEWLDLPEALVGAAAVVTHGGHGTVMAALAAGVPLVSVPLGRDQPYTAARIEALGAGRTADATTAGRELEVVLHSSGYREAACRLRDRIASLSDAAVDTLTTAS